MTRDRVARAIALLLTLTIAMTIFALPLVSAQKLLTKKTYAYIGATPNPVGVGQETLIHVGITDELQTASHGWEGLTVTVTKPDGTSQTLGPFRTDSTGGTGTVFRPASAGNYTFQTHFPAQRYNWTSYGGASVWYEASDSPILTLVVIEEQNKIWPGVPLPTEYWTRPIDQQAREWYTIAGNWLTEPVNLYAPFNDNAPDSAHVLWARPIALGGLAGGELGLVGSGGTSVGMETGDAYEGFFSNSIVLGGRLYYNQYKSGGAGLEQDVVCVDLHTGEELWVRNWNNARLSFGQLFYWESYNYQGTFPYLWTEETSRGVTTWTAFDAFNGRWIYNMTGIPGGDSLRGSRGEIYKYSLNLTKGWMTLWNSSRVVSNAGSWIRGSMGTAYNVSQNGYLTRPRNAGYEWNKTIPVGLPGSVDEYFLFDRILGSNLVSRTAENLISGRMNKPIPLWGISVKPGQEGMLLFNTTWTPPNEDLMISFGASSIEDKVFTLWSKETRQYWGFSMDTGQLLWGPTPGQDYLDIFGQRRFIAYGKLFAQGMSGILHCYDVKTGKLLWTYSDKDQLSEVLWSNQWSLRPLFITDGKIYMGQSEHSANQPLPRGAPFVAVDVETGKEVWKSYSLFRQTDWGGRAIIGDSIIATMDTYDQRIYAIGKGPTATTIMASPKTSIMGNEVILEGTVSDISPGTEEYGLKARFPNGVPAVSDSSMSDWMLYVYKQFPRPSDVTGVAVTLSVFDANNNFREIGTTTANADGFYSFEWAPDIEGNYTVYASFKGSNSYYPSHAETAFVVNPAAEPVQAPDYPQPIDNTMSIVGVGVAILAAIAVVGLVLYRKKP